MRHHLLGNSIIRLGLIVGWYGQVGILGFILVSLCSFVQNNCYILGWRGRGRFRAVAAGLVLWLLFISLVGGFQSIN